MLSAFRSFCPATATPPPPPNVRLGDSVAHSAAMYDYGKLCNCLVVVRALANKHCRLPRHSGFPCRAAFIRQQHNSLAEMGDSTCRPNRMARQVMIRFGMLTWVLLCHQLAARIHRMRTDADRPCCRAGRWLVDSGCRLICADIRVGHPHLSTMCVNVSAVMTDVLRQNYHLQICQKHTI